MHSCMIKPFVKLNTTKTFETARNESASSNLKKLKTEQSKTIRAQFASSKPLSQTLKQRGDLLQRRIQRIESELKDQ